jgi:HAD superfamily hydrolase (TIGR01509 family)
MTATTRSSRAVAARSRRATRPRQAEPIRLEGTTQRSRPSRHRPLQLDGLARSWQIALNAALEALDASTHDLPAAELTRRRHDLLHERQLARELLVALGRVSGVKPLPWLSPVPITHAMLGLPTTARACVFDLEGVLTDSNILHAAAWAEVFDDFLLRLSDKTGWHFIPFDRDSDYRTYVEGRTRLEGVHAFLESRGIHVPEGRPTDPAEDDTAHGLSRRKHAALGRRMHDRGVSAHAGGRRYLEAAGQAGLARAVISASMHTVTMLDRAGLVALVDDHIDANTVAELGLHAPPAPDVFLAACRNLGVPPEYAVAFTHSPAGVAAARAAGMAVVAVAEGAEADLLIGFGADHVTPTLAALLDKRLAADGSAAPTGR